MGYLKYSISGLSWMGGIRVISRFIAFIRIAILARILLPSQFGIFGIATLVLAFFETITSTGINIFLIQENKELKDYINTAWIISILRGLFISLILILLAPIISGFFNSQDALNLIYLVSLVSFIRGFINPSRVKYIKELEFNKEFWFSGVILFVDSSVSIILAIILKSPISLVWGLAAGASLEVLMSFAFIRPLPKLSFEIRKGKEIFRKGKWVTFSSIFDYLFQQGDDMVVGKILNTSSLGIYQAAYKISTLPLTEIARVVNKVTFPVYVKISGDKKRLKKAFLKTTVGISLIVIPFGLVLFLFSKEIVLIILGENWLRAVPVLRILSLFGVIRAISSSSFPLFNAIKRQNYVSAITFISILGLAITIVPFILKWNLEGAGLSALIGSVVALPVIYLFLKKSI